MPYNVTQWLYLNELLQSLNNELCLLNPQFMTNLVANLVINVCAIQRICLLL